MSSPAGPRSQSHLLSHWIPSSSRAGVFLNGSLGEMASVRSTCSSLGMDMTLNDSICSQFAPLPVSVSSSCAGMNSIGPPEFRRDIGTELFSSDMDSTCHTGRGQQSLIERLEQLKQLQQQMQEQLKCHQRGQLQKLQNEQQRLLGKVQTATESSMWNQDQTEEQKLSEHRDDCVHQEKSLQSTTEDQENRKKYCATVPHDRPITLGHSGQTFEELLERQLNLEIEKQSTISVVPVESAKVKRPFLRRGEGLARFTKGKARTTHLNTNNAPILQVPGAQSHQSSEPKKPSKSTYSTNVITQRKTAVLNKDNTPSNKISAPTTKTLHKVHVLGAHQTVSSVPVDHQSRSNKQTELQKKANCAPKVTALQQIQGTDKCSVQIDENSFDAWLKERGENWEREHQRECKELGEFELLERAADEISFSSSSSFINNLLLRDGRRLSSTPVKLPLKSSLSEKHHDNVTGKVQNGISIVLNPPETAVKSASLIGVANTKQDEVISESSEDEKVEDYDSPVVFHQSAAVTNTQEPVRHCFQVSAAPYYKHFYQDRDGACSPEEENESNRDSTLVDVGDHVEFDDNDTWNEPEDSIHSPSKKDSQPLKRKVAFLKGSESDCHSATLLSCESEAPPTCQLVAKLFPALKTKPSLPPPILQDPEEHNEQGAAGSTLLRERLVELETEIERFKKENAALSRLRQENQEHKENLRKERSEFEQKMAEQLAKWEEFKNEEVGKLQREKNLFRKHATAARARPDKQERNEIQFLKQQLNTLQEDLRKREARWSSTNNRLRQQLDTLSAENATLRDQVRMLEKLRLSTWKNAETERERGRPNISSNGFNKRRTKSKSPSSSFKDSPPENSNRSMDSPEVQKLATAKPSNTRSTAGSKWQKEPGTVNPPNHIPDELNVSEGSSQQYKLPSDSVQSALHLDSSKTFSGLPEMGQDEISHKDGKIEKVLADGGRLILFPNGTRKEVSADGQSIRVTFFNGDTKHIMEDQRVIYYYAEAQTTHTTYPDGMEVLQFPNNQIEKHYQDGRKEITFPDLTVKNLYPDGREESILADGTIIQQNPDGSKQIQFNTGQRELHTAEFKRREYPDGTVKTVYTDGRQETRYPTGRVRLKDPQGCIIMDTQT